MRSRALVDRAEQRRVELDVGDLALDLLVLPLGFAADRGIGAMRRSGERGRQRGHDHTGYEAKRRVRHRPDSMTDGFWFKLEIQLL